MGGLAFALLPDSSIFFKRSFTGEILRAISPPRGIGVGRPVSPPYCLTIYIAPLGIVDETCGGYLGHAKYMRTMSTSQPHRLLSTPLRPSPDILRVQDPAVCSLASAESKHHGKCRLFCLLACRPVLVFFAINQDHL